MNILLMVPWDQQRGGVATVVNKLAGHLIDNGHTVYFLFPGESGRPVARTSSAGFPAFELNLRVPFIPMHPLRSIGAFWLLLPLTLFRLLKLLRTYDIDIVNIHYPTPAAVYFMLCRAMRRIRVIVSVHGADMVPIGQTDVPRRWSVRWLLRSCDHVTAPSKSYLEHISTYCPYIRTKATHIHNGIEVAEFQEHRLTLPADDKTVLCIAAHNLKKGIDVLLRAMALVRSRGLDLKLELLGDGPLRHQLEQQARQLGIDDVVQFVGFQGLQVVKQHLQRCSLVVLPSRVEPFGIAILEAMVFGKPVLATTVGGIPEIITHLENGYLVPPDDPDALADGIATLSSDPGLRQHLGAAGFSTVLERFTHRHTGATFEALFRRLAWEGGGDQDRHNAAEWSLSR
jgi:glycosyltransferase involved in cell wall biosynthesis